jgi:hypothetical protein
MFIAVQHPAIFQRFKPPETVRGSLPLTPIVAPAEDLV